MSIPVHPNPQLYTTLPRELYTSSQDNLRGSCTHYNEYNCPAVFLGSKYKARAEEICRYKGWDEQEYTDFLFRIVAEYIDEYVWESFKETIASDTEGWTDELRVIKGR